LGEEHENRFDNPFVCNEFLTADKSVSVCVLMNDNINSLAFIFVAYFQQVLIRTISQPVISDWAAVSSRRIDFPHTNFRKGISPALFPGNLIKLP